MAYVQEEAVWKDGVYQLEVEDYVLGGPDGTSNKPSIDLACRTLYLKQSVAAIESNLGDLTEGTVQEIENKVESLESEVADLLSPGISSSSDRTTVISAGEGYTVPEYTVGSNQLLVMLFGAPCTVGVHYNEVGNEGETSTTITFTSDIPTYMDIYVRGR